MHTGLAVITGTEGRPHAYVALTRGTDTNTAYVFTPSPKRADPAPGPRPAPELAATTRSMPNEPPSPPRSPHPPHRTRRSAGDLDDRELLKAVTEVQRQLDELALTLPG